MPAEAKTSYTCPHSRTTWERVGDAWKKRRGCPVVCTCGHTCGDHFTDGAVPGADCQKPTKDGMSWCDCDSFAPVSGG